MKPFISLCIPTRNKPEALSRLMDSISCQTYKNYEIVIADNSEGTETEQMLKEHYAHLAIQYERNRPITNMPENWNIIFSRAQGEWLKMVHDDDWFVNEHSLAAFAAEAAKHENGVLFSACIFISAAGVENLYCCKQSDLDLIVKNPSLLYVTNYLSNPSCMLLHHSNRQDFDPTYLWLVDSAYYISLLQQQVKLFYISEPLLYISLDDQQMSARVKYNEKIQVYEHMDLLQKLGYARLKDIRIYDRVYRMIRTLKISNYGPFEQYADIKNVHVKRILLNMIGTQKAFHFKKGIISKILMLTSFLVNSKNIARLQQHKPTA